MQMSIVGDLMGQGSNGKRELNEICTFAILTLSNARAALGPTLTDPKWNPT